MLDLQIQIRRLPKPVVAMVAGYAIGGGHVLHVVCDLTIAADNARFGQTGPRVGSFDGGYGIGLLARQVGREAREGDLVPLPSVRRADRARMGLVNTVVPLDELEAETVSLVPGDAAHEPAGAAAAEGRFATPGRTGSPASSSSPVTPTLLYYMSEEAQEGRDAFVEKRPPDFTRFPKRP